MYFRLNIAEQQQDMFFAPGMIGFASRLTPKLEKMCFYYYYSGKLKKKIKMFSKTILETIWKIQFWTFFRKLLEITFRKNFFSNSIWHNTCSTMPQLKLYINFKNTCSISKFRKKTEMQKKGKNAYPIWKYMQKRTKCIFNFQKSINPKRKHIFLEFVCFYIIKFITCAYFCNFNLKIKAKKKL